VQKSGSVPRHHFCVFNWLNQAIEITDRVILAHDQKSNGGQNQRHFWMVLILCVSIREGFEPETMKKLISLSDEQLLKFEGWED